MNVIHVLGTGRFTSPWTPSSGNTSVAYSTRSAAIICSEVEFIKKLQLSFTSDLVGGGAD